MTSIANGLWLRHVHEYGGRDAEAGGGRAILTMSVVRHRAETTERRRRRWVTHYAWRRGRDPRYDGWPWQGAGGGGRLQR
jgi:hypothetical protein